MSLGDREDELLDTLEAVINAELPYVLIGGWAIAAFNQRFTTDVDVVIPGQAVDDYTALLADRGYKETADIERNDLYEGRAIRFEKDIGNPVQFDAMIDALGCRQTEAEWSYRYLAQHSVTEELRTGRPVTARMPERELLFCSETPQRSYGGCARFRSSLIEKTHSKQPDQLLPLTPCGGIFIRHTSRSTCVCLHKERRWSVSQALTST
jgi:hypothetical protein